MSIVETTLFSHLKQMRFKNSYFQFHFRKIILFASCLQQAPMIIFLSLEFIKQAETLLKCWESQPRTETLIWRSNSLHFAHSCTKLLIRIRISVQNTWWSRNWSIQTSPHHCRASTMNFKLFFVVSAVLFIGIIFQISPVSGKFELTNDKKLRLVQSSVNK